MMNYNLNTIDLNCELSILQTAYNNVQNAYLTGDIFLIEQAYNSAASLLIPGIKQHIEFETKRIIYSINPCTRLNRVPISMMNAGQVGYNVRGCLNALQKEIWLREVYLNNNSFAQRVIFRANHTFSLSEVLDSNPNGDLKVEDLLSVLKLAYNIAEAISPENEDYARASATIAVCQVVDAILNNRPAENKINGLLHLMVSFLSTNVKNSLNDPVAKQNVTLSSIIVDLAIDFFCKK